MLYTLIAALFRLLWGLLAATLRALYPSLFVFEFGDGFEFRVCLGRMRKTVAAAARGLM